MFSRRLFTSSRGRNKGSSPKWETEESPEPSIFSSRIHSKPANAEDYAGLVQSPSLTESAAAIPSHPTPTGSGHIGDPLGLSLLYAPESPHSTDIIFIHGLGGSSRSTWCKDRRLDLFWPQEWLPKDSVVQNARIFSFGYNAKFRSPTQMSTLGISDFSKSLLYDMLFITDTHGRPLNIGEVPIAFVTHSMGGLVFKKAYIDAQADVRCAKIVKSIKAAIFLSTPHHGANLAQFLNRVLTINFKSSPKDYIAELSNNGPFVQTLNEQFRPFADDLQIFSFYETLKTSFGLASVLILEPSQAQLGYGTEVSRSLNADHQNVCKFNSPQDSNFKVILGALRSVVSSSAAGGMRLSIEEQTHLSEMLDITESFDDDLQLFSGRRAEGTCKWVLEVPCIQSWMLSLGRSEIIWLQGRPGRGKSVIAAFLINQLQDSNALTQYFFFRAGDETKDSMALLLKALVYQTAVQVPAFGRAVLEIPDNGYRTNSDWKVIWKQLFIGILFGMDLQQPLFWVIDGLDEARSPHSLFELLSDIESSKIVIKVLVSSRVESVLSLSFERTSTKVPTTIVSTDNNVEDMKMHLEEELRYSDWGKEIKSEVTKQVLRQANGNFLWVHFVLQELSDCNTELDIKERLSELPSGMDDLYRRMEETISRIRRPKDKILAQKMLIWTIYSRRSLSLEELADILEPEFGRILNIANTLSRLCGHFIAIEGGTKVGLVHQTAREYLTTASGLPFSLDAPTAHAGIFEKTMGAFLETSLRSKLHKTSPTLFEYRAISWPHHLIQANLANPRKLELLLQFLGQSSVLTWINILASLDELEVLVDTSKIIHGFAVHDIMADHDSETVAPSLSGLKYMEDWSRDLLRILGKFGDALSQKPDVIFNAIAPLCPRNSAIYQAFGSSQSNSLSVLGLPEDWDDCFARLSVGSGAVATSLCCRGELLAVGTSEGLIVVWDSVALLRQCTIDHGEPVSAVCFSAKGDIMGTCGFSQTRIWDAYTGRQVQSFNNPVNLYALSMCFIDGDTTLLVGTRQNRVLKLNIIGEPSGSWDLVHEETQNVTEALETKLYLSSPVAMGLTLDGTRVAMAYKGFPFSVWSINPPKLLQRVIRAQKPGQASKPLPFASSLSWHPGGDEVMGIFMDGCTFKMNVIDGSIHEERPSSGQMPLAITCSPDGTTYATCGSVGCIKIFDYATSALIYQIDSGDAITSLCFAQNGKRLYGISGNYCSAWEPDVLRYPPLRSDGSGRSPIEDKEANADGRSMLVSDSSANGSSPAITIIVPSPKGVHEVACVGDEDGGLDLYDCESESSFRIDQTPMRMTIDNAAWSQEGDRFCYVELTSRITIMGLESASGNDINRAKRYERFKAKFKSTGRLLQVLLLPGSSSLLLLTATATQMWSLGPAKMIMQHDFEKGDISRRWIVHPRYPEHLLLVTPQSVSIHRRDDLSELTTWWFRNAHSGETSDESQLHGSHQSIPRENSKEEVRDVQNTYIQDHIMVRLSYRVGSCTLQHRFLILDTSSLDPAASSSEDNEKRFLCPLDIPEDIPDIVEMPLNILLNRKLIFVDQYFWVCSWSLRSTSGADAIHRHFPLPKDWVPLQSLDMLHVTESGGILCPRKGGLAIIRSNIASMY
ncbi:hypothetical protein B0I35DRAFT_427309 [Stachybotrys elegans]|uniref:NACHT domain-containing protein n=1 Tax=Stachybotrys elegans TaxID=80388 RepID=A0A8K0WUI2_9HYPO|nr:hypothetical protein B0I35DRAFT_427309 [Stachybotrys elegans]